MWMTHHPACRNLSPSGSDMVRSPGFLLRTPSGPASDRGGEAHDHLAVGGQHLGRVDVGRQVPAYLMNARPGDGGDAVELAAHEVDLDLEAVLVGVPRDLERLERPRLDPQLLADLAHQRLLHALAALDLAAREL